MNLKMEIIEERWRSLYGGTKRGPCSGFSSLSFTMLPRDILERDIMGRLSIQDKISLRMVESSCESLPLVIGRRDEHIHFFQNRVFLCRPNSYNPATQLPRPYLLQSRNELGKTCQTLVDQSTGRSLRVPSNMLANYHSTLVAQGLCYICDLSGGFRPAVEFPHWEGIAIALEYRGNMELYYPMTSQWRHLDIPFVGRRNEASSRGRILCGKSAVFPHLCVFGDNLYVIAWDGRLFRIDQNLDVHFVFVPEMCFERRSNDQYRFSSTETSLYLLQIQSQREIVVYRVDGEIVTRIFHVEYNCFVVRHDIVFAVPFQYFCFPHINNSVIVLDDDLVRDVKDQYRVLPNDENQEAIGGLDPNAPPKVIDLRHAPYADIFHPVRELGGRVG